MLTGYTWRERFGMLYSDCTLYNYVGGCSCSLTDYFCLSFRLYVNWRFMRGIEAQFLSLQKGFNELIPQHLLRPFDEKELEVSTQCTM